jgi:aspartate aminotransferase-like enzyme
MLNFAVGPVMMDSDILKIGAEQIPYFRTEEFSQLMLENERLLNKCVKAPYSSRLIVLTASGTAAMEATIMNLFNKRDKILVVNGGTFGSRFKKICDVLTLNAEEIHLNNFESLTSKHLEPYEGKGFTGFLINVHETSTGILYDMNLVKDFCQRNNLLLVVDAISSFLADKYDMSAYGINATILSSQKGLALPPGMSFVILDERAQARVRNNKVNSLYFDFKDYLLNGERGQTPYTPAVSIVLQLYKRLKYIDEISVDKIVEKVAYLAHDFRRKIKGLPLEIPANSLSNALTPLKPIAKLTADEIFKYLKNNYDIFVCPNGGELSKTLFRVGHIGALTIEDNDVLVKALFDMNKKGVL